MTTCGLYRSAKIGCNHVSCAFCDISPLRMTAQIGHDVKTWRHHSTSHLSRGRSIPLKQLFLFRWAAEVSGTLTYRNAVLHAPCAGLFPMPNLERMRLFMFHRAVYPIHTRHLYRYWGCRRLLFLQVFGEPEYGWAVRLVRHGAARQSTVLSEQRRRS